MGNMMRGAKNDMVNPDNGDSSLKGKITKVTSFVCFFSIAVHTFVSL